MKTSIKILLFFCSLFLASCADNSEMLTVIKSNGSCYREFTENVKPSFLTGDSIDENKFPIEVDSLSNIRWKCNDSEWINQFPVSKNFLDSIVKNNPKDSLSKEKENSFTAILRLDYASVKEMHEKFRLKQSHEWSKMKVNHALEKKFRWFYTYYNYSETYPHLKTDFKIPIDKYMTNDEASFWFTGQPNIVQGMNGIEMREFVGKLEEAYNVWYGLNVWSNEFDVLVKNYDLVKIKPVSVERLKELRDTIFFSIKEKDKYEMKDVLNQYFKTQVFSPLWLSDSSVMRKYEKGAENQEYMTYFTKDFNYKLIMPGKIISAINAVQHSDTLSWKLTAYRMAISDYTIEAQSRKTNIWAFIVTGLLVILAIGIFLWKGNK